MSDTKFNPEVDDLFFIHDVGMNNPAWTAADRWIHSITVDTFEEAFGIIKLRWLKEIHNNVFDAMKNSYCFFNVLKNLAFQLTWDYCKSEYERELIEIRFSPKLEFTYHGINNHNSKKIEDWTFFEEDVTWSNVIEMEDYKGNTKALVKAPDECKYYNGKEDTVLYKCLHILCRYFPDYTIKDIA